MSDEEGDQNSGQTTNLRGATLSCCRVPASWCCILAQSFTFQLRSLAEQSEQESVQVMLKQRSQQTGRKLLLSL